MQPGRRGRREQWAGPLIPHNHQPRVQSDEEQEDTAVGRAAGGSSGDSWQRRKQRGHGTGHTTRGASEQSASLRHETTRMYDNSRNSRIALLEEKLDILTDRLMERLAPDHPSRTVVSRRQAVHHANEGRVLYLTDGRSPVDDGAMISQAPATSDRRTRNVSQRLGEREELESCQEASDTDNPFQSGEVHVRRVMRRVHVCLDIEKLLRAKAFLNVNLPGCYHMLLDTGANISLCGDRSLLTNVRKSLQATIVSTASGEKFTCEEEGEMRVQCTITKDGNVTIEHTFVITAMVCAETPLTIFSMSQFLGEEKTVELSGKSTGSWVCMPGNLQLPVHLWEGIYVLKATIDQSRQSLVIAAQSSSLNTEAAALLTRCAAKHSTTSEGDKVSLNPALPSNPVPTILWHWRLGHTSDRVQRMLAKGGNNKVTYSSTHRTAGPCHVCRTSKFAKLPLKTQGGYRQDRAERINSQWNVDLKDMGTVSEPGRFRYFLVIVDSYSGFIVTIPLTSKGETKEVMQSLILQEERSGRPAVMTVVSDNGSEFANLQLQSFVKMKGIIWNFTPDYTSAANGRAERAIRTVTTIHRAISYQAQVPQRFWHFSVQQATLIFNSLPNLTNRDGLSPWQLYQGREFDYEKLKVFGCTVFVANEEKLKNDMPAITAVNLGNSEAHMGYQPGYLVYNPANNKVIHTRQARFDETFFHFRRTSRLHIPPGQEYVGLREEDEQCSVTSQETDPGATSSEDDSMAESSEDDGHDADWQPEQSADQKLSTSTVESVLGSEDGEVGRKRTRSDFRSDRTSMERQYVNRKVTYGRRAATITQVVFRNGAFYLKIKYDDSDNDWIIVPRNDPKLCLTSERVNLVTMIRPRPSGNQSTLTGMFHRCQTAEANSFCARGILGPQLAELGDGNLTNVGPGQASHSKLLMVYMSTFMNISDAQGNTVQLLQTSNTESEDSVSSRLSNDTAGRIQAPKTRKQMLLSAERHQWLQAELKELNSMKEKGVWEEVDYPRDRKAKIAPFQWVYTLKYNTNGEIAKFKARLVILGNLVPTDGPVYAPTSDFQNVRLICAIAAGNAWLLTMRDISTAFLNADIDEEIYMLPPEQLAFPRGRLLRLKKSLYGLSTSPRSWFKCFTKTLKKMGCRLIGVDEVLFVYENASGHRIIGTIFVDDILLASQTEAVLSEFLLKLSDHFEFSESPQATGTFLGVKITQDLTKGIVELNQTHFIHQIVERFEIPQKSVRSVLPHDYVSSYHLEDDLVSSEKQIRLYQALLGSLLYLTAATRPDICFAVSLLSRFAKQPRVSDVKAVIHLTQYVYNTRQQSLTFSQSGTFYDQQYYHNILIAASDSTWGTDPITRRSQGGIVISFNGGPVNFSSKLQKVVSLSSTEAELYSCSNCAKALRTLRSILLELGFVQRDPTIILVDNAAVIHLLKDRRAFSKLKHIAIRHRFTLQMVDENEIIAVKISTTYNPADILTKVCPVSKIRQLAPFLFGNAMPHVSA